MVDDRCTEPSLDELFGDVAMRLLMQRDGVTESDIRALVGRLKDARTMASSQAKLRSDAEIIARHTADRRDGIC